MGNLMLLAGKVIDQTIVENPESQMIKELGRAKGLETFSTENIR